MQTSIHLPVLGLDVDDTVITEHYDTFSTISICEDEHARSRVVVFFGSEHWSKIEASLEVIAKMKEALEEVEFVLRANYTKANKEMSA